MPFTEPEQTYLASQALGRIATVSAAGLPDVAPVTFRLRGDDVLVGGMDNEATIKFHNVVATGSAAFVVDDLANSGHWEPRGVKIRGAADIVDGPGGRPEIRIRPRTVWSWGINDDAETYFNDEVERRDF